MADFASFAASSAIFFIVGGSLMLSVVVILVVLRAALPMRDSSPGTRARDRVGPGLFPTPSVSGFPRGAPQPIPLRDDHVERGRMLGAGLRPNTLDDVMEAFAKSRRGIPRLLSVRPDRTVVRVYDCYECEGARGSQAPQAPGCAEVAGLFDAALGAYHGRRADAREIACRRRGAPVCEFEVRH